MCAAASTNKRTRARAFLEEFQGQKARTHLDSISKLSGKRNISAHQKTLNKVKAEASLCIRKRQPLTPWFSETGETFERRLANNLGNC